jgi:type IV pilus assembly protein PilA
MKLSTRRQGFTLVEIMIVVVIIGLLAAMAIPAFQKVRKSSLEKSVYNDARQIGAAAQQYFMENGATTVAVTIVAATGEVQGPLNEWVKKIGTQTTLGGSPIQDNETTGAFTLQKNGAFSSSAKQFDPEGKEI